MNTQLCTSFMVQQTEIHEMYGDGTRNCFQSDEYQTITRLQLGTGVWGNMEFVMWCGLNGRNCTEWLWRKTFCNSLTTIQLQVVAGPVAWPPRSSDLNPLDFYLWGRLKALIYATEIPNIAVLQRHIENGCLTVRDELNGICNISRAVRWHAHTVTVLTWMDVTLNTLYGKCYELVFPVSSLSCCISL